MSASAESMADQLKAEPWGSDKGVLLVGPKKSLEAWRDEVLHRMGQLEERIAKLEHPQALKPNWSVPQQIAHIMGTTGRYYGLSHEAMMNPPSREEHYIWPRQVAMYLCRHLTEASSMTIGNAFGRGHDTVLFAVKAVQDAIDVSNRIREKVVELAQLISPEVSEEAIKRWS